MRVSKGPDGAMYADAGAFPIAAERVRPPNVAFGGVEQEVPLLGRAVDALHSLNNEPPHSMGGDS